MDPLTKTFRLLEATQNIHAVDVLLAALEVPDEQIRESAVSALLRVNSTRGKVEIIRRFQTFPSSIQEEVQSHFDRLSGALKQSILHGDKELSRNSLELICLHEDYDRLPILLEVLQGDRKEIHQSTIETVFYLVNQLYDRLRLSMQKDSPSESQRNAPQIKRRVLADIQEACENLTALEYAREIVECVLILGDANSAAVKKVLVQGDPDCRKIAGELLHSSQHPGVMQLIIDCMSKKYPPRKAFEALQKRQDPKFVHYLLEWLPERLSRTQLKNFRQIESVAWLNPRKLQLDIIPERLQPALISFVFSTGLPRNQKTRVQEWLLSHGGSDGRSAASSVLPFLDNKKAQSILFKGLKAEDPQVQAWATGQLRDQGVPDAVSVLIEQLDNPHAAVQNAAREELQSFNMAHLLANFEQLDGATCRRAGELVQKIDPEALLKLQRELANPARRKRIRAARAARAMGLQKKVFPALVAMLEDSDSLVRRTGIEVLGSVPTPEAIRVLENVLDDPNPRVRETVSKALQQIGMMKGGNQEPLSVENGESSKELPYSENQ